MLPSLRTASLCLVASLLPAALTAQTPPPSLACHPIVSDRVTVASPQQRLAASQRAQPPVDDPYNGFAWPDTPLGVIKTAQGYKFFASDGGAHYRQTWEGETVGSNKSGSVVTTLGTLSNPLGTGDPLDVTISPGSEGALNPNYGSYGYMGGGPVFQVPAGMPGAGNLLVTYHAELPGDALYASLGLAESTDGGQHWTDLGEIIRLNQAYTLGLDGFEIGDGPLVLSPDGKYLYLYFPDWKANGTLHTISAAGVSTTTNVSVARAPLADVLRAAFASPVPRAVPFQKYSQGSWILQPAISGLSTDLIPNSNFAGDIDVHWNSAIQRYGMIISNDTQFGYAESADGLHWTPPTLLGTFGPIAAYPTAVGLGDDPHTLGSQFYVYFTDLPTDGSGWTNGKLQRLTVTCQ